MSAIKKTDRRRQEKTLSRTYLLTYYLCYTIIFLINARLVFAVFNKDGMSFIWKIDGWTQHIKALYFYSDWLKNIFKQIFVHHHLGIDLFSFSLGYGSDVITTLHYYVVGDPFAFLSVFIPADKLVYYYSFSVYLRLYLAGAAFAAYCFYMKHAWSQKDLGNSAGFSRTAILAGSLTYCFPMYTYLILLHHPFFINAYVFLPLLLIGTEMVLRKSSKIPMILTVFLAVCSNFYFFYMEVILVVIYVFVRLAYNWKKLNLLDTFKRLRDCAVCGVTGLMMGSFLFLPVVHLFGKTQRLETSVSQGIQLLYPVSFYKNFYASFLAGFWVNGNGRSTVLGFSCIVLMCMILLFMKKNNRELKLGVFLLMLVLLLPFGGKVMNGFSYASNRWMFGFIFLMALITARMWDDLMSLGKKPLVILIIIYTVIFAGMFIVNASLDSQNNLDILKYVSAFSVLIFVLLAAHSVTEKPWLKGFGYAAGLLMIMMTATLQSWYAFSPDHANIISEYLDTERARTCIQSPVDRALLSLRDTENEYFRYGAPMDETPRNSTAVSSLMGINYYWSLADGQAAEYFAALGISNKNDFNYRTLDNVTSLTDLASVKYYVIKSQKGRRRLVPYGFEKIGQREEESIKGVNKYSVYKNQYVLPLGYTYDSVITDSQFLSMNYIQRQNALLQGIYMRKEDCIEGFPDTEVIQDNTEVKRRIADADGVTIEKDKYIVSKNNGRLSFELEGTAANSSCSVMFQGLQYIPPKEMNSLFINQNPKINILVNEKEEDEISTGIIFYTKNNIRYLGRHDFLVNMGYSLEPKQRFTIEFPYQGTYKISSLNVYSQPMNRYPVMLSRLRENALENIAFNNNKLTGTVDSNRDKILCLSIPYSEGWKAKVNGKETEIHRANIMYMAIPIKKGSNAIELSYCTPMLLQGIGVSITGLLLMIVIAVLDRRRRILSANN